MVDIVDKRNISKDRTTENRQRFLRRIKGTIKEQMPNILNEKSLKDLDKSGGTIRIKRKTIREPQFHHDVGGEKDFVKPGNDEFVPGDRISKPDSGSGYGKGKKAGSGESEDDFVIELSKEEFLKYFFEDLELPDLLQTKLTKLKEIKRENAGFQPDGSPNRLSLLKSFKQSLSRRIPIRSMYQKQIEELLYKISVELDENKIKIFNDELIKIQNKLNKIPLFEEIDLRYRSVIKKEIPLAHATMIMIMGNSGSMGQKEKNIARKFFWLLYSFLRKQYDQVDMIFISHTEYAEELDEYEFFNTRDSGGTLVSSALDLTTEIINERLLDKTNIYIAQVSDGDNHEEDNGTCSEILEDDILPYTRYFAYLQVDPYHRYSHDLGDNQMSLSFDSQPSNGLWSSYKNVSKIFKNLQLARVSEENQIYSVFQELFKKK